jgi:tetratricopeptide (TPR) repeat protein
MNASLTSFAGLLLNWLADYYLAATLVLSLTFLGWRWMRQPAQRIAAAWTVMLELLVLAVVCALPFWPKISFFAARSPRPVAKLPAAPNREIAVRPPIRLERLIGETPVLAVPLKRGISKSPEAPVPLKIEWTWMELLSAGYLTCAASVGLWLCWGAAAAALVCKRARSAPAPLRERLSEIVRGNRRAPRLLVSSHIGSAVALGVLRPTIVLPARLAANGPPSTLGLVLSHEYAHIRHCDLLLLALGRCLLVVFFAHPLFWWLRRAIRVDQELLADAVAAGENRHDYAEELLHLIRGTPQPSLMAVAAVGIWEGSSQLSRRITMLLDETFCVEPTGSRRLRNQALGIFILLGAACSFVTLQPARLAGEQEKPSKAAESKTEKIAGQADKKSNEEGKPEGNPSPGLWMTDFEAAKAKAKAEKKMLLLEFTGSDWCGPCMALKADILDKHASDNEFLKQTVLVEVDFPHEKKQSEELKAQNKKLRDLYQAGKNFPEVLLLDSDGKLIARYMGFDPDVERYLKHLAECPGIWKSIPQWRSELEKAQGLDRVRLLDKLIDAYDKLQTPVKEMSDWRKEIVSLDPENQSGLMDKYIVSISMSEADRLFEERKIPEAVAVLHKVKHIEGLTDEQREGYSYKLKKYENLAKALEVYWELKARMTKAEGLERVKLLDQLVDKASYVSYWAYGCPCIEAFDPNVTYQALSQEVIALDPDNKSGLKPKHEVNLARIERNELFNQHKLIEIIPVYHKALKIKGLNDELRREVEFLIGRFARAGEAQESYLKHARDLEKAQGLERAKLLDQMLAEFELFKEWNFQDLTPFPDKQAWLKEIISLDPKNESGLKNKAEFALMRLELPTIEDANEKLARVEKVLALSGTITPDQMQDGWTAKGEIYFGQKKFAESRDYFKKALEIDPKNQRCSGIKTWFPAIEEEMKKAAGQSPK